MKFFRIVYMGTPEFAVPSLERLISDGHDIAGVVTQPDRKKGRGKSMSFSPVKQTALKHGLKILQPEKIKKKECIENLRDFNADLFVTCAYGQILPQAILDIPKYGCINVHASLLPEYRGAAPIHRAVLNGSKITGITTMMTDHGMDTGDILLKSKITIDEDMTTGELHDILKTIGARLLAETIKKLGEGTLVRIPQDDSIATKAPMLRKKDSIIKWENNSKSIHDQVRALNPWPGCFTTYKGKRLRLLKTGYSNTPHIKKPGSISFISKDTIEVACGTGFLRIFELQFENGKTMEVSQCWHNIDSNVVLGRKE